MNVEVDIPAGARPNPLVERSLALALREASTNIFRHAHATYCQIRLVSQDGAWRLEVSDDGIGSGTAEGNGLRGMRGGITTIGGQVRRGGGDGTPVGRGTDLVVTIPA